MSLCHGVCQTLTLRRACFPSFLQTSKSLKPPRFDLKGMFVSLNAVFCASVKSCQSSSYLNPKWVNKSPNISQRKKNMPVDTFAFHCARLLEQDSCGKFSR